MPLKTTLSIVASDPQDATKVMTIANNPTTGTVSIGLAIIALTALSNARAGLGQALALDTSQAVEHTQVSVDGQDPDGEGPAVTLADLVINTQQVADVLSAVQIGVQNPASTLGLAQAVYDALGVFLVLFPPPTPLAP
jgi:hypothetical protein